MWSGTSITVPLKPSWSTSLELMPVLSLLSFSLLGIMPPKSLYVSKEVRMSVGVGTKLGSIEITDLLGRGGMGEVYRARDLKLKREVAIKILPNEFGRDPDRVARFQREAEVLASLNHPNIAAIYDLQEDNGSRYLVLELIEGETLAERIRRGPIPIDEALNIARCISEALEAAHEKDIIHRDLKPGNIMLTKTGVKVLDFGLAKVNEAQSATELSNSPTVLSESTPGVILGTAADMSPEQARGKIVDKRTDIWAFGCVLYELLSGNQAFQSRDREGAGTIQDILAAVLERDPDWTLLPATTPPSIRVLLRRCLQKDAKKRLRDAADVHIEIEDALSAPATPALPPIATTARWRHALPSVLTGLFVAVIAAGIAIWNRPAPRHGPVSRTVIALSQGQRLAGFDQPAVALSPDGTQLVYVASDGAGTQRLYLRAMDALEAKPVAGTEGASGPFFSPDGRWIGFAVQTLKKVSISGGATLALSDVWNVRGASWGANDTIALAPLNNGGLSQIYAAGGPPQPLTTLKEGDFSHRWPQFLPGGKGILFKIATTGNPDDWQIAAQRLDTSERKILVRGGTDGRWVPSGHLVYYRAGTIIAAPFDLARLEVTGTPTPVLEGVMSSSVTGGGGQYSFSSQGLLVYVPGPARVQADLTLIWADRNGVALPLPAPPRPYNPPSLSPDGRLAAVPIGDDIWIYDLARDTLSRLTFEGANIFPT